MSRLYYLILFSIFLNCSKTDTNKIIEYDNNELTITNGTVIVPEDSLFGPLYIEVDENNLFLYDNQKTMPISVFNKQNGEFSHSFGKAGRGPGEVVYLGNIELTEQESIILFDAQNLKVVEYEKDKRSIFINEFKFKPLGFALQFRMLDDSLFVSSGLIGDRMLAIYNSKGEFVSDFGTLKGDTLETVPVRQHVYRKTVTVNKSEHKLAVGYLYTDLLEIYDFDEKKLASVSGPLNTPPIYTVQNTRMAKVDDTRLNYLSIKSTDKYIYGLFHGEKISNRSDNVGNIVHIFDWNGKFIKALKFDEYLFDIAVDDQYLYGLSFSPNYSILKYEP